MLKGLMEIVEDQNIKNELWKDDFTMYYKDGKDGVDYTVIRFTAVSGRFYSNFSSEDFKID
jgi:general stress protein 26